MMLSLRRGSYCAQNASRRIQSETGNIFTGRSVQIQSLQHSNSSQPQVGFEDFETKSQSDPCRLCFNPRIAPPTMSPFVKSWLKVAMLFFMVRADLVTSVVNNNNSNNNNNCSSVTVPKPAVKYMLNSDLVVSWPSQAPSTVTYSAKICCLKPAPGFSAVCPYICPGFKKMSDCKFNERTSQHQCRALAYQYVHYRVLLRTQSQGCQKESGVVQLTPLLEIAHPSRIPTLEVKKQANSGLLVQWKSGNIYVELCYSLTCHERAGSRTGKMVFQSAKPIRYQGLTANITLANKANTIGSYQCCVKSCLCDRKWRLFSEKTCNTTAPETPHVNRNVLGRSVKNLGNVANRSKQAKIRTKRELGKRSSEKRIKSMELDNDGAQHEMQT